MSCCRDGHRTSKSKDEFRMNPAVAGTNCKIRINVVVALDGSCIITSLEFKHNYTLILQKHEFIGAIEK